jgi:hypothetical protein
MAQEAQEAVDAGERADAAGDPVEVVESTDVDGSGKAVTPTDSADVASRDGSATEESVAEATAETGAGPRYRGSYAASRFGLGFAGGLLVAGAIGVATNSLALAVFFGFSVGILLGIAAMELGGGAPA